VILQIGDMVMTKATEIIRTIHSEIDIAEKHVWFLNKPNFDIVVTDKEVMKQVDSLYKEAAKEDEQRRKYNELSSIERARLEKSAVERLDKRIVLLDLVLSNYLNANVLYIVQDVIRPLLNLIDKDIDANTCPIVRLKFKNKFYIITEATKAIHKYGDVKLESCLYAQRNYYKSETYVDDESFFEMTEEEVTVEGVTAFSDYNPKIAEFLAGYIYRHLRKLHYSIESV